MIGDETRRKVAAELRALDVSDIEVDGHIIDSPKYVGLLLMRMLEVVCDYRDGLHYFPAFFSAQAVVELFADLIDRPTCRNVSGYQDVFECSECRCRVELITEVCNELIAAEVINGAWGNGGDRRNRLARAGYDPDAIQAIVNRKLHPSRKSNEQIATQVIAGKWGNGSDRRNRLASAGYDPDVIQAIVNRKLGA